MDWNTIANQTRANTALTRATQIIDTKAKISPHSLRFGAADDLQVVAPIPGHSLDQISDALGHLHGSRESGLTKTYTAAYTASDHWQGRIALRADDTPFNTLVHATAATPSTSTQETETLEGASR